jgi:hypothetical protein
MERAWDTERHGPPRSGGSTNLARPGGRQTFQPARLPPPPLSQSAMADGTGRTRRLIDEDEGRTVEALFSLESWTDRACYLGCILVRMKAAHVEGEKHVVCLALWPWASFQF